MRYHLTFKIFKTEKEANSFAVSLGRKKHNITPWSNTDGTETGFICWYYY